VSKRRLSSGHPQPPVRPPPGTDRPKNRLIRALPEEDYRRIVPHLKTVRFANKDVLHKRGEPLRYVYFPNGGVYSVTAMMKNGTAVEVATVGDEGMVGLTALFGGQMMPGESMVQVPDTDAERMSLAAFESELERRGALHETTGRYAQGVVALMMQSTACIALHHVNQRCCRWLLMTHDRVRSDEFKLSHEFLAMMLGSTRPTVTTVAGTLQRAGLIRYTHSRVRILDRAGLEDASCECYATVKTAFDRLGL
jgi:CRP-like cAMP-binding protein